MRTIALVSAAFSTALCAGVPTRIVNTFRLSPKYGTATLEWVSPSTFRFERTWATQQDIPTPLTIKPVPVSITEQESGCAFETRYITVRVDEDGDRLRISTAAGAPVTELHVKREGGRVLIEHPAPSLEHFFGLGPRTGPLDLRGSTLATTNPFLLSTTGYGEFFREPGKYTYDVAATDPQALRVIVPGDRIDLFFYFGPTAKSVFEEHMAVTGPAYPFDPLDFEVREPKAANGVCEGSWAALGDGIRAWLNSSLSAMLLPRFDLAPYAQSDPALFARAAQLASLAPVLYAPVSAGVEEANRQAYRAMESRRKQFEPYLFSYTREVRDRGLPVVRPLALDFEDDPAARIRGDEFLLGDELLVAPAANASGDFKVYFPRGVWTDLDTDQVYPGRHEETIHARIDVLPMFARNGTIVPLAPAEGGAEIELHYFPSLGAEFFLAEANDPDVTQVHAAPAGDLVRLEIESRADRVYEWVVRHSTGCRKVESGGTEYRQVAERAQLAPGTWHYDARRKALRIRVRSVAGGDEIVNVTL
jgi:alpha-glucosidase (family GH31 glycosyl hydrolase)